MKLAIVGCGYVSDFYLRTLKLHPELELVAVYDRELARANTVGERYGARCYDSLETLLGDRDVELVVNLTNPNSHYEVSRACLDAGRHVYSEKPLAMSMPEARELVSLAERRGLVLAAAPCNVLGESAQTVLQQLRAGTLGTVRAVHAEMDDGAVYLKDYWLWRNSLGVPWPFSDEFDVGCVVEHAAYYITWLVAFWGPVASITAFSECLVPSKSASRSPDYAVGVLRFANGVVARLTCSIIAPENRGLLVIGEAGQLSVSDCWQYDSEVRVRGTMTMPRLRTWIEDHRGDLGSDQEVASALSMLEPGTADDLGAKLALRRVMKRGLAAAETELTSDRTIPFVRSPIATGLDHNMDFSRGVAECADAALHRRPCRLSGEFALHVLECTLALRDGGTTALETSCGLFEPMPWAR